MTLLYFLLTLLLILLYIIFRNHYTPQSILPTFSSFSLTFLIAINFYLIKNNWLKLVLFFSVFGLIELLVTFIGWKILLPIGMGFILPFTIYYYKNESNSYF